MVRANPPSGHTHPPLLPQLVTSGGHHKLITWNPTPPQPVLTSSGGHQRGRTHPTGMLSCLKVMLLF